MLFNNLMLRILVEMHVRTLGHKCEQLSYVKHHFAWLAFLLMLVDAYWETGCAQQWIESRIFYC